MRGCVIAQGPAGLIAAELEVVGGDLNILLAQVLGEDAADLAVADEAHIPLFRIGRHRCHFEAISRSGAIIAVEFRPSRSPCATCRYRISAGLQSRPACWPWPRCQGRSSAV